MKKLAFFLSSFTILITSCTTAESDWLSYEEINPVLYSSELELPSSLKESTIDLKVIQITKIKDNQ